MVEKTSALLSTVDATSNLMWSRLLELQVASFFPFELQFLMTCPGWAAAHRVLDAGCGNGYYLSQVKKFFPEKVYAGIDISEEHISAARQNSHLSGVEFSCEDFFNYEPHQTFDVVVLRLIVQHLAGIDSIFSKLEKLLVRGGTALIVEPDPAMFCNHPPTPFFGKLLFDYTAATAAQKINRADLEGVVTKLSMLHRWEVVNVASLVVPQVGPFTRNPLLQIFSLWIDIFERSKAVAFDFDAVRAELDSWAENPISYNQVGLKIVEIKRDTDQN
jgi:SAM-dependent methyltransferase